MTSENVIAAEESNGVVLFWFEKLKQDTDFDPDRELVIEDPQPWNLDEQHPPRFSELLDYLTQRITQEHDGHHIKPGPGQTSDSGGGGQTLPGGPKDGQSLGQLGSDSVDPDTGGTSPVQADGD